MAGLAAHLHAELQLTEHAHDELAGLDARLVRGASDVRAALAAQDPAAARTMTAYFARQALRKNGPLESLHRKAFARQCASELAGADGLAATLQSMLSRHIAQACYVLDDLELPGGDVPGSCSFSHTWYEPGEV